MKNSVKMILLFSHKLTERQKQDAKKNFGITDFIYLPRDIQKIWSEMNPDGELDIRELQEIIKWLMQFSKKDDFVLVQGDFGAVYYLVDFCLKNDLIAVYSTTRRQAHEIKKDKNRIEKVNVFEHVTYRKYRRYHG